MDKQLLAELVAYHGIETSFQDAWGNATEISELNQQRLLAAMGYPIEDEAACGRLLHALQQTHFAQPLDPVSVQTQADSYQVTVRLPLSEVNHHWDVTITTEQGQTHQFDVIPVDGELTHIHLVDGVEYQAYQLRFTAELPLGYHQLSISSKDTTLSDDVLTAQRLIITPARCFQPAQFEQQKQWGVSIQLYALRSKQNWGVGDFRDLAQLVKFLGQNGADFVGLNPIHALYPAMPESASPYSPSSRRWLNIIYICPDLMPGAADCAAYQQWLLQEQIQAQLSQARQHHLVQYASVMQLKLSAMQLLFQWFEQQNSHPMHAEFTQFIQDGGESLQQLALYDALHQMLIKQDPHAWGWPNWPEQYRDLQSPEVQAFAEQNSGALRFFCYLQFIAQHQLAKVQSDAKQHGMLLGLYRDLAVGVSEASTEIWANPELYCRDASVGAPPDILGPKGQNWGLPPMHPYELFQQGYQPLIDLFRANMQHSGALRIDHVMALLRLWWVPKGAATAGDGAYVYYPIMDLLGILALESQRHQAVIIGEDLGTVPDGIFELLQQHGMYSYRVFFFEQAEDGGFISTAHYPVQAMSTLTTHDLPTLIGYWHCSDLKLGRELGLYNDEILPKLMHDRHQAKQQILNSMHGHHILPADYPRDVTHLAMDRTLNYAMQQHLAKGSSQLLCLQLEDWLEMTDPVNIPGTSDEYPNWRRKLTVDLEDMIQNQHIQAHVTLLTHHRRHARYN
jgi:4-alpha-glucanotransferase